MIKRRFDWPAFLVIRKQARQSASTPNLCSFTSIRSERGKSRSREGHQLNYRCTTKLHNVLDGLAMNLEKGYRPTGDFIIEDADYQPAGIPSLCIEVCPTFYRDWTIPELVMPVHDMSRSVTALIGALVDLPQQLVRILRGERQIGIDAGVHVDPMPVDVRGSSSIQRRCCSGTTFTLTMSP